MSSVPSEQTLEQLIPLLGSLARLVASGHPLGDDEYETLLLSADLDQDEAAGAELRRWGRLLERLRAKPTEALYLATREGLLARGVPEAPAQLALDAVRHKVEATSQVAKPAVPVAPAASVAFQATPDHLDFGSLTAGKVGVLALTISGGPAEISTSSEHVQVIPPQIGPNPTEVQVMVQPVPRGLLWVNLRLASQGRYLDVPVIAQWAPPDVSVQSAASASSAPPVPAALATPALEPRIILIESGDTVGLETAVLQGVPGDEIALAPGNYRLTRPLVPTRDLVLSGEGAEITSVSCDRGPFVMKLKGVSVSAQGVTFEHTDEYVMSHVVEAQDAAIEFQKCRFVGGAWDERKEDGGCGLVASGRTGGTLQDCEFADNGADGINLDDSASLVIQRCEMRNNADCGIAFFGKSGGKVDECVAEENGSHGIYVDGEANPELIENACRRNGLSGLSYFGGAKGRALNNRSEENGDSGIHLQDRAAPTLQGNVCVQNETAGVAVLNSARPVVTASVCKRNRGFGLYIEAQAQPSLRGNECSGNRGGNVRDDR